VKHIKIDVIFCLVFLPALSRADGGYGYPIPGDYEATVIGTPDKLKSPPPSRILVRRLVLDVVPDIKKPDIFFYDEGLRCTLAYQEKKAPLVDSMGLKSIEEYLQFSPKFGAITNEDDFILALGKLTTYADCSASRRWRSAETFLWRRSDFRRSWWLSRFLTRQPR
jgi:hypothetical protein